MGELVEGQDNVDERTTGRGGRGGRKGVINCIDTDTTNNGRRK